MNPCTVLVHYASSMSQHRQNLLGTLVVFRSRVDSCSWIVAIGTQKVLPLSNVEHKQFARLLTGGGGCIDNTCISITCVMYIHTVICFFRVENFSFEVPKTKIDQTKVIYIV